MSRPRTYADVRQGNADLYEYSDMSELSECVRMGRATRIRMRKGRAC